jgi:hypothetical protein
MAACPQWKASLLSVIDKTRANLAPSAPKAAGRRLEELRQRIASARTQREAAPLKAELDELLESRPYYRAATRRYIHAGLEEILARIPALLELFREYKERVSGQQPPGGTQAQSADGRPQGGGKA